MMDWLKKHWVWVLGGGVILYLLTRNSGSGSAAQAVQSEIAQTTPTADSLLAAEQRKQSTREEAMWQLQFADAKKALEFETASRDLALQRGQAAAGYELAQYDRQTREQNAIADYDLARLGKLTEATKKAKVQCDYGDLKIDENGRPYCRVNKRKGNTVTDIVGFVSQIGNAVNSVTNVVGGMSIPGTPPINPAAGQSVPSQKKRKALPQRNQAPSADTPRGRVLI